MGEGECLARVSDATPLLTVEGISSGWFTERKDMKFSPSQGKDRLGVPQGKRPPGSPKPWNPIAWPTPEMLVAGRRRDIPPELRSAKAVSSARDALESTN